MAAGTDVPTRFYTAFAALDHETMNACYAPEATFVDPLFDLQGDGVRAMWRGLCTGARDFSLTFEVHESTETSARVTWIADYMFPATRKPVHNVISTTMQLRDGLIIAQRDEFSFHTWAKQALGMPGLLLGWAPPFRKAVAARAMTGLRL